MGSTTTWKKKTTTGGDNSIRFYDDLFLPCIQLQHLKKKTPGFMALDGICPQNTQS